jgi:hypothetical protein
VGIVVAVADAVAMGESGGVADLLQGLAEFQEARGILRKLAEAGFLDPGVAVDDGVADAGDRQADELAVAGGVTLRAVIPATIFVAEVFAEVADVEQLVRILVGIVEPDQHQVRAGADIRRHGGLRADVFPAFLVDADFDARGLGEFLGVGEPGILVTLDEGRPAQHAQRRALLGRVFRGVLGEGRPAQQLAADNAGGGARRGADNVTSGEFHRHFLLCAFLVALLRFPRFARLSPSVAAPSHR